mmetsp:Transcript_20808/g.50918  ORF Transcript_20808/g.50918 Transcript_20808/m.50918 type:complete len:220 (+) Transcript_20808:143-802(+)
MARRVFLDLKRRCASLTAPSSTPISKKNRTAPTTKFSPPTSDYTSSLSSVSPTPSFTDDIQPLREAHLVSALASTLARLCAESTRVALPSPRDPVSIFFSSFKQPFTLQYYAQRVVKYAQCSPSALFAALVYMERIRAREFKLRPCEYNVHRLFLACVVLAVKFLDDEVFTNAHYARVGGITIAEMNKLELATLKLLNFELQVSVDEYRDYVESMRIEC